MGANRPVNCKQSFPAVGISSRNCKQSFQAGVALGRTNVIGVDCSTG